MSASEDSDDTKSSDFSSSDETTLATGDFGVPLRQAVDLCGHSKAVTSLSVDPAGSRCITGCDDGHVRFWDFAGMDGQRKCFRSIEPVATHKIVDLCWSLSGDRFLVAPLSWQPRLYDRDGRLIAEYAKGDMYLRDARNTDGHTGPLTSLSWHPQLKDTFATASSDSTIRVWNCESPKKQKNVIVFKHGTGARGAEARTHVTSLAYSPDGRILAGAGADGSLRFWKADGPYTMATMQNSTAHDKGDAIVKLEFGPDNTGAADLLLTRSESGVLRIWDRRKIAAKPLFEVCPANNTSQNSHCATWAPHGGYIVYADNNHDPQKCVDGLAVLSVDKGFENLLFENDFDSNQAVANGSNLITALIWHPRLNQMVVGMRNGKCSIRYHDSRSWGGALHFKDANYVNRGAIEQQVMDEALRYRLAHSASRSEAFGECQELDATPTFLHSSKELGNKSLEQVTKRQATKLRQDTRATRMPERRKIEKVIGGGVLWEGQIKDTTRDANPRDAILKYAEQAANDPYWVAPAYSKTQPKPVLAEKVLDDDELARVITNEDRQSGKRRIPPS